MSTVVPTQKTDERMLDDIPVEQGNRIAIIGPSGAGKTWLAATWPNPGFLDTDRNIGTLKQAAWRAYAGVEGQVRIPVSQPRDEIDRSTGLVKKAVGFWDLLSKVNEWSERPDIDTIVIDSITTTSGLAMSVGVSVAGQDRRSQTLKEAGKYKVMLYTMADFGAEMSVMEQLLDQLPDVGKTIICTAHMRTERSQAGALLGYSPLITGDKHRAKFGTWFNEVWYLDVQGVGANAKRVLQCRQDNLHPFVKTTMGLPNTIENPTYKRIMELRQKAA